MSVAQVRPKPLGIQVLVHEGPGLSGCIPRLEEYVWRRTPTPLSHHPAWLKVLEEGLGHVPYCLEVLDDGKTRGFLALIYLSTVLFGRILVSLPYLNSGGVLADDCHTEALLIDNAVRVRRTT